MLTTWRTRWARGSTSADKRKAVLTLLEDDEWGQWSDREIARRCKVHHSFVSRVRPSLSTSDSGPSPTRTVPTKHGPVFLRDGKKLVRLSPEKGGKQQRPVEAELD